MKYDKRFKGEKHNNVEKNNIKLTEYNGGLDRVNMRLLTMNSRESISVLMNYSQSLKQKCVVIMFLFAANRDCFEQIN